MGANRGFTLLELIIVIAILAILAVIITLALNPAELLARSRDAQRLSDSRTLSTALQLYTAEGSNPDLDGSILNNCENGVSPNASIFISGDGQAGNDITDTTFSGRGTPDVLVANQDNMSINGSGWIPVDFATAHSGLANLPLDPRFSVANLADVTEDDFLYLYGCGEKPLVFELNTNMESDKFSNGGSEDKESKDGGNTSNLYEIGTDLSVIGGGGGAVSYKVFITSQQYYGNAMGGISGADSKCQARANAVGLGGVTWKAWIVADGSSPSSAFVHFATPIYRIDGAQVVDNWADLIDGTIVNPINVTENGSSIGNVQVWTGDDGNTIGEVPDTVRSCATNWDNATGASTGWYGLSGSTNSQWVGGNFGNCSSWNFRLYCFSQSPY